MSWKVTYHPEVLDDLEGLGAPGARRIVHVIDTRIRQGEPDKLGKPLRGSLAGYRRIRVGSARIVYCVKQKPSAEVWILAVGPRRGEAVYTAATKRVN